MATPEFLNLKDTLLHWLPSPQIKLLGRQLHISTHLEMVGDSLWAITKVIIDANLRAIKEPELRKWLSDVYDMHMDLQNLLEVMLDYNRSKQKPKVSSCNFLHHGHTAAHRHAILLKLKEIAKRLNCLLSRAVAFDLLIDAIDSMNPNHDDYSSIIREEVVGRDDDINIILNILFRLQEGKPSTDINEDVPFIVFISGPQSVGKTTLARMIYHHPLVYEFFKHRVWVDYLNSDICSFDHNQIAEEYVGQLHRQLSRDIDIWSHIFKSLSQTRCLFILDKFDMSNMKDKDKLDELKKSLINLSAPGSRFIIVSESYIITGNDQTMNSDVEYRLGSISCDAWAKLFLRYAIPRTHSDQVKQKHHSIEMTNMLNLATQLYNIYQFSIPKQAKVLGSISRHTKLSSDESHIRNNKYYKLMDMHYIPHEITSILLYIMLFEPLPLHLVKSYGYDMVLTDGMFVYSRKIQQIFLGGVNSFMRAPDNFKEIYGALTFDMKKKICHFRMGSDIKSRIPQQCRYLCIFILSNTRIFLSELCAGIANNLRTLILYRVKEDMNLHIEKCQVASSSIEIPESLFTNLVLLSIIDTNIQFLPNTIGALVRLRYLNLSEKEIEVLPESICDLYNLVILGLSYCKKLLKLPEQIDNLGNLEILRLGHCMRLQKLPKSITSLVSLKVLDVEACHWLKELPEDLGNLKNLMDLNMIGCASLTRLPIGISKLINLEALSGYMIDDYGNGSSSLKELQSLMNIEQLHVQHLERVLDLDAIASVKYLENLVLHWEWWNMYVRANEQLESAEILEGLQPHFFCLKHLDVISYLGIQFPTWMMRLEQLLLFKDLAEIRFVNLKRCDKLPLLALLPSLVVLEISGMDSLANVGNIILDDEQSFLSLENLTLSYMPILVKWNLVCPCLQQLTIIHCPKLVKIFGFNLKNKLTIWLQSEMLSEYSTSFQYNFKNIKELEIVGCHELRWLPNDIKQCRRLQTLSIIRCSKLQSLPNWLQEMTRLKWIFVSSCIRISHISEELKQHLKDQIIVQGCPRYKL